MSRFTSPYVLTEARLKKWQREGRGAGEGAAYRPWLQTRNVKSQGRKHRLPGILHDRTLHLMSDLERNAVLHFERQPQVLDIKEQFPLDRDVTRSIAKAMGVRHPTDPTTGVEIVMTTDMVVSFVGRSGAKVTRAFSVKEVDDLLLRRTQEKQELERRYWERIGLRWLPLLDVHLRNRDLFNAILWAREWFNLPVTTAARHDAWITRCQQVFAELSANRVGNLGDLVRRVEARCECSPGEALSALRHLIARQRIDYAFADGTPTLSTPLARFLVCFEPLRLVA